MRTNELLGIEPLPTTNSDSANPKEPVCGLISVTAPFVSIFMLGLILPVFFNRGNDPWGFAPLVSLMFGGAIGGLIGFPSAIISLIRKERWWGLAIVGFIINIPLLFIVLSIIVD